MKLFITLYLICLCLQCTAQIDTIFKTRDYDIRIAYGHSNNYLTLSLKDSSITIVGDTMASIKNLLAALAQQQKNQEGIFDMLAATTQRENEFIKATVGFINKVPDVWRSKAYNSAWPRLYALLKENGYYISRIK